MVLPWSAGSAWTSQRSLVGLSGGYRGRPLPGWPGCKTGSCRGGCHRLSTGDENNSRENVIADKIVCLYEYRLKWCEVPLMCATSQRFVRACGRSREVRALSCCCRVIEAL